MSKIKKLWKLLAGSISWNLNESKTTDQIIKSGKKEQQNDTRRPDIKKRLAGS